jgi:hypothetical protein
MKKRFERNSLHKSLMIIRMPIWSDFSSCSSDLSLSVCNALMTAELQCELFQAQVSDGRNVQKGGPFGLL